MRSVIIATVPIHGHVTPLLAVARYCIERGDRVRFITGSRFADVIAATGAEHVALPAAANFDDRQDWDQVFPQRAALRGSRAIAFDVEHIFVRPGPAQHDAVVAAFSSEPADVVLTDPAFAGGALLLGRRLGERPPIVVCGVVPLTIGSRDTAPYGLGLTPLRGVLGRLRNAVLTKVATNTVFPPAERVAQAAYRELYRGSLPYPVLDWPRHAEAVVQFTVPAFEYPRSDAPETLHFAGPLSATGSDAPLPPWWSDLDGSRPVVHLTQGTIANKDYGQIIAPALEALAGENVMVVVATGGRPVSTLPSLPANARAAEFLPYDDLLPRTAVFVTNGGYGGVQYALRYGVPIVSSGGQEDKPEVSARVAWSGVGRRVKAERPSAAAVGKAIHQVLDDARYRRRAQELAEQMRLAGGLPMLSRIMDEVSVPRM